MISLKKSLQFVTFQTMKQRITKNITRIYQQIIIRPVPHSLISWRFLSLNPSLKVKLHRRVFFRAWPQLPRLAYLMILIYSSSTWLLWFAWKNVYTGFKKNHKLVKDKYNIPKIQQLLGLLNAAILNGIPASAFYQFKLFEIPSNEWLDYVYAHELPHWHSISSPNISSMTHKLFSDKGFFSENLSSFGLPAVMTLHTLDLGSELPEIEDSLFNEQSVFIKPNTGSHSEGCLSLYYYPDSGSECYALEGITDDILDARITKKDDIVFFIKQQASTRELIVQPLLKNHAEIQKYNRKNKTLITLRVVTACLNSQYVQVVYALLEIPAAEIKGRFYLIAIDCHTGRFINSSHNYLRMGASFLEILKNMEGEKMPYWKEVVNICKQAHLHSKGLVTIGWDIVITTNGVFLLEGNINWSVQQHQIAYDVAILNSRLNYVYI